MIDFAAFPWNEPVTITHTGITRDADGNATSDPSTVLVPNTLVAGRSSTERADTRQPAVITGVTVYMPSGVVVNRDDLLVIRGLNYQVEGVAFDWQMGVEVAAKRVSA